MVVQILQAKNTDHRAELFARAIKTGADIQSANRKLLLRMRLYVSNPFRLALRTF
jgi:COP9 signalosome complex subunit 1